MLNILNKKNVVMLHTGRTICYWPRMFHAFIYCSGKIHYFFLYARNSCFIIMSAKRAYSLIQTQKKACYYPHT